MFDAEVVDCADEETWFNVGRSAADKSLRLQRSESSTLPRFAI